MTEPSDPSQPPVQPASPSDQAPPPGYQQPPPPSYQPPQLGYQPARPVPPQYGYGQMAPVPDGMYFDPASGLVLPNGTLLASVGRRIGAYFLGILLAIVTLGIGYIIWGLVLWGRGTSPAFSVLHMKVWRHEEKRVASWGIMALRDIIGRIADSILGPVTALISFILFASGREHKALHDLVAGTVVLYDPNKVLG